MGSSGGKSFDRESANLVRIKSSKNPSPYGYSLLKRENKYKMLGKLITYTIGSGLALYVASRIVPGVEYTGGWEVLALAGFSIALLNLAIAPILKLLALPLRILTLNLFSLVIDMLMVWLADALVPELAIHGIFPLFWTTLLIMAFNFILWTILSPSFKS